MENLRHLRLASVVTLLVLLLTGAAYAQTVTVTGTVKDTSGIPVTGATIVVLGEVNKGATADLDGNFTIPDVQPDATLRITFVGMKTLEIALEGKTHLEIVLEEDSELLDEVVVVGYGTQKKVNLTGAVSSVDAKTLEARPVQNVGQALQGTIPGLNLNVNNAGGALDARMSLNIRGTGTIGEGSNAAPLVLIDGTEGDLFSLNPNDIDNISVLKDASSSAIYGSRAAFGVILITTKSGKEGKARVSYNANVRFNTATQVPEMPNSLDFAKYWNAASSNNGAGVVFDDHTIELIKGWQAGTLTGEDAWGTKWVGYQANEPWSMYGNAWCNNDWFAEMYRSNVPSQEHSISVSGGSDKINYFVSGAFLDQNGLIRHGKDKFNRYNLSGKFSADLAPWITLTYNTRWVREDYTRPSYMTGLFFHNIARRWPTNPLVDPHGHYVHGNEILQMEDGGIDDKQTDRLYQQLIAEVRPLEGWMIRLEANYNTTNSHDHWDVLPIYYYDPDEIPVAASWDGRPAGETSVSETFGKTNYFNGRFYTEYARLFNEVHDFKILGGMDMEYNHYLALSAERKDLITPSIPAINQATNEKTTPGWANNEWSTMGMFARINYAYDNRYLLEVSVRRDGSSRFVGDKRWATFPSFSLGWNIANEEFFAPLSDTIGLLKIRGSWGALGNTNTTSLYPWYLAAPTGSQNSWWIINGAQQNTANVPGLVSPELTWERVESYNVGLDFGLFNNRLQGSFDYFVRNTRDMVGPAEPVSSILGASLPKVNNTDMNSKGWEMELKWRDTVGEVNYGFRFVMSDDVQTVTKYYNPTGNLGYYYDGRRMGEIWGYTTVGIAQTDEEMTKHLENNKPSWGTNWAAGDIMYADLNGDGKVNNGANTKDDYGDLSVIGNSSPRYRFSLNADMAWKGIDFSIYLQGVGKRDFWDASPYFVGANAGMWQSAAFTEHFDFWRPADDTDFGPNPDAYYPRPLFDSGAKNFQTQTRYLQDASYLRIKNLQVGYTLPQEWTAKAGISRLRLYFSADNLVTFTKMSKIFDPEALGGDWGAGKLYPLQRSLSFGMNLNF